MSIKELTVEECYANMNSDIKLWEQATTMSKGTDVTKSIILPFGIGEMSVKFQGVDNGIKRRAAAEQWGAMVRERIKDAIDDESVTARAQQAAALRESEEQSESMGKADNGHSDSNGTAERLQDQSAVLPSPATVPVQAHALATQADSGPEGTDFAARAEWLREQIGEGERILKGWRRELKAIDAALAVLGEEE